MDAVTIGVGNLDEAAERFCLAFEGVRQGGADFLCNRRAPFAGAHLKALGTHSRMVGQGPMSLEVAARFVGMMGRPFTVTFRHFSMLAFWTKTTARKSSFRTMPSIWNVAGG